MAKPSNSALRRPPLLKRSTTKRREAERHYAMKPSHCLCLLFLVSILVASSAVVTVSPNKETTWEEARKAARAPAAQLADEAFLARLCDREQQRGRPPAPRILPWCTPQLHASRRQGAHKFHHLPVPPPSRDGEQIDPRYGVSKRLVPSGPNRLHN